MKEEEEAALWKYLCNYEFAIHNFLSSSLALAIFTVNAMSTECMMSE